MTGRISLRLHMISDWHIGTGGGDHGHVDRTVQRDDDGLPHVPAKTLVGVWRDACELAAHALDSGPTGAWHTWVGDLFGTQEQLGHSPRPAAPRPARLAIEGALRMPGRAGTVLRERPLLRQATTFRKPGVAIDPRTGTAAEEKFRTEEMARAGVELVGTAEIRDVALLDGGQRRAAMTLLWCGARLVESIGGKRRRGAGRCRLELVGDPPGADLADLTDLIGLATLAARPPDPPPHRDAHVTATSAPATGRGWEQATLVLRTRTPVLAYAQTQGNLVRGRDHLPGWILLPNVLGRLGGQAAALALHGNLVVTAAFPGRPVPRVFTTAKGDATVIRANTFAEAPPEGTKPARRGYLDAAADGTPTVRLPEMVVRMHNTIRDDVQRPTEEVGGVYIYAALAPQQEFRAHVRVRTGVLPEGWARSLQGTWRVGRSAKDDYGLVRVTLAETRPVDTTVGEPVPESGRLRVWLQSDLLVRDVRLRPSTSWDDVARTLERALASAGAQGVRLEPVRNGRTAVGVGRVDSWHRRWGLPRPTLLGIAAGSCLTFRLAVGAVPPAALRELETAGVGERTAEGFGQVLINHPLLSNPITHQPPRNRPRLDEPPRREPVTPLSPSEAGHETARLVERAAWRHAIYGAAERIAADPAQRSRILPVGPTPTQLNAVRRLLPELDDTRVTGWLRRLTWPETTIQQLAPLLTDSTEVWERLRLPEEEITATHDGPAALREELRGEAARALLAACLVAHAREAANNGGTSQDMGDDMSGDRNADKHAASNGQEQRS